MGKNVIGCGLYVFHLSRDGIYRALWIICRIFGHLQHIEMCPTAHKNLSKKAQIQNNLFQNGQSLLTFYQRCEISHSLVTLIAVVVLCLASLLRQNIPVPASFSFEYFQQFIIIILPMTGFKPCLPSFIHQISFIASTTDLQWL